MSVSKVQKTQEIVLDTYPNERALFLAERVKAGNFNFLELHQRERSWGWSADSLNWKRITDIYRGSQLFVDPLSLCHAKLVIVDLGEIGYFDTEDIGKFQPYPIRFDRSTYSRPSISPRREFYRSMSFRECETFLRDRIFSPSFRNLPIVGMSLDYKSCKETTGIRNRPCFGMKVNCQVLLLKDYDESVDHRDLQFEFDEAWESTTAFGSCLSYFKKDRKHDGYEFAASSMTM